MTAQQEPYAQYRPLSVAGRLALALASMRRWADAVGFAHPGLDEVSEQMWSWLIVTPETFDDWYRCEPATLGWVLASDLHPRPVPEGLAEECTRCSIDLVSLREALARLVSMVYSGLFGAIEEQWSWNDLGPVLDFVTSTGAVLPPVGPFLVSLYADHDWGRPTPEQVAGWRALATTPEPRNESQAAKEAGEP